MIKWYLVLYMISGNAINTIPQSYDDKSACEEAAKDWDDWVIGKKHMCIKSPSTPYKGCTTAVFDAATGKYTIKNIECIFDSGPPKIVINPATKDKGYVCQPGATTCEVVK